MPATQPRVQVTVDPELAAALDEVEPQPRSRSRLIRDLALQGALAERERATRARRAEARDFLLAVVRGETDYDPSSALEVHAQREADVL